jgi:hypothetical protein
MFNYNIMQHIIITNLSEITTCINNLLRHIQKGIFTFPVIFHVLLYCTNTIWFNLCHDMMPLLAMMFLSHIKNGFPKRKYYRPPLGLNKSLCDNIIAISCIIIENYFNSKAGEKRNLKHFSRYF